MDNKTGKFILSLRQEKGLSQYQLAEMIPISRQAVSKWERGENIPDSYTMLKLSDIFNVTINELLLGERQLDNSVESLEKTTLNILDQSNKKTKKIKRMLLIFTIIITVLLLSFLSYYFITSYNAIRVYTISGDNKIFNTNNGIFITTREKYYLKLGKLRYGEQIKIDSIELFYKDGTKEKLITNDLDIDNLNIWDNYGYSEKIKDINVIKNASYLRIKYNDDKESIIKLVFRKDFINNNLFQTKNRNWEETPSLKVDEKKTETIVEDKKDEEKKEEEKKDEPKNEETTKAKEISKEEEQRKVEEVKPVVKEVKKDVKQEVKQAPPVEEEITIEKIIEKIKEKGTYSSEGYFYETIIDNNTITYMYQDKLNLVTMFDLVGDYWDYDTSTLRYTCTEILDNDLCKKHIFEKAKEHLFN